MRHCAKSGRPVRSRDQIPQPVVLRSSDGSVKSVTTPLVRYGADEVKRGGHWLLFGKYSWRSEEECYKVDGEKMCLLKKTTHLFDPARWSYLWSFELSWKAHGRWQYSFYFYNTIQEEDALFEACCNGYLREIQALCSGNMATPYDRTSKGLTLLHVSNYDFSRTMD